MQDSSYGVPIGTVIAWPLETAPLGLHEDHWLECNGQPVDSSKYPRLAELMSNVPDYTGMFLRGRGGDADSLGVKQGDTSRELIGTIGAQQFSSTGGPGAGDTNNPFYIATHYYVASFPNINTSAGVNIYGSTSYQGDWYNALTKYEYSISGSKDEGYSLIKTEVHPPLNFDRDAGWENFDVSRVWPTSKEFRPVNKAVRYMIKAK